MGDRAVFAYFNTPEQAEQALKGLEKLKLIEYKVERFDGYAGTGYQSLDQTGNTITGEFPGLGYLTLGGDFDQPDAGILAAASVSASGYSTGGPDNRVTGRDIMLVAIVGEEDYEQATQIVKEAGAL
ncbi:hypothetical protein DFQ01_105175 [Paenibacillus cellulosilyticus]|uniref:Heat induced stress protein YflT n=1 Tax=Paenibacillus cellulosilyticus TaxID=375489 RepID=A0A2V2YW46_9BACL|nr:hypothetical protein [Paenibacillus cellulosilyticus]PWW05191.1 hypothetical protein DFQ01_105175 [Paenibacillus cellulosilyticus]QKS43516.1 hypothetical protein HUB94_03015 [Paenibacillus cellulosilyticus]